MTRTEEILIGTEKGIIKTRTVRRRRSPAEKLCWEGFDKIEGTPWEPIPARRNVVRTSVNIPSNPEEVYSDWTSWNDFLGQKSQKAIEGIIVRERERQRKGLRCINETLSQPDLRSEKVLSFHEITQTFQEDALSYSKCIVCRIGRKGTCGTLSSPSLCLRRRDNGVSSTTMTFEQMENYALAIMAANKFKSTGSNRFSFGKGQILKLQLQRERQTQNNHVQEEGAHSQVEDEEEQSNESNSSVEIASEDYLLEGPQDINQVKHTCAPALNPMITVNMQQMQRLHQAQQTQERQYSLADCFQRFMSAVKSFDLEE